MTQDGYLSFRRLAFASFKKTASPRCRPHRDHDPRVEPGLAGSMHNTHGIRRNVYHFK